MATSVGRQPPSQLPPFRSGQFGPTERTREAKTPLQVLQLILTSMVLESIVLQTKLFAQQKGIDFPFCVEELQAFIAVNLAMGLLRLPQIRDYWSKSEVLATPWFRSIFSRDRFLQILRYLHLNDSSNQKKYGEDGYDPLYKVRPLLDHLAGVLPVYYQPTQQLSIDEMMVGTRCRVAFLQYMPKKPTKFGIKIWVNSESKSGYVLALQVYTGAANDPERKGVASRVVKDLLQRYEGKNHLLYVDNFYSSPTLFIDLLQKGIYCTGTVRTNRKGFPSALIPPNKSMPQGSYRFASSTANQLTAVWWKDRKDVFVISTLHKKAVDQVMKRPKGSKEKINIPCPSMIVDYNQNMGGVDLTDQHLSYYSLTTRRTLKWWKKLFWRFVDICVLNSWIIYKSNFPDSTINSHRLFRIKLVQELVQPLLTLRSSPTCPPYLRTKGREPVSTDIRLLGKHFSYKHSKRQRCAVCSQKISLTTGKTKDKKTQNYCPKCNVFLCLGECFELYHTKTSYK